jgi:hypothetical protein
MACRRSSLESRGPIGVPSGPALGEGAALHRSQALGKSLRKPIGLLRRGESPAKLALGEDCVQPSCEQLLVLLYRQWLQPPSRSPMIASAATRPRMPARTWR